jgi:hypothetical protein
LSAPEICTSGIRTAPQRAPPGCCARPRTRRTGDSAPPRAVAPTGLGRRSGAPFCARLERAADARRGHAAGPLVFGALAGWSRRRPRALGSDRHSASTATAAATCTAPRPPSFPPSPAAEQFATASRDAERVGAVAAVATQVTRPRPHHAANCPVLPLLDLDCPGAPRLAFALWPCPSAPVADAPQLPRHDRVPHPRLSDKRRVRQVLGGPKGTGSAPTRLAPRAPRVDGAAASNSPLSSRRRPGMGRCDEYREKPRPRLQDVDAA